METRSLTPRHLVMSAIVQPSKPSSQWCNCHLPMSFKRRSSAHAPKGHRNLLSTTSTKPACSIRLVMVSSMIIVLPNSSPHSVARMPHSIHMLSGGKGSVAERQLGLISACSIHPPGWRCLWWGKATALVMCCFPQHRQRTEGNEV